MKLKSNKPIIAFSFVALEKGLIKMGFFVCYCLVKWNVVGVCLKFEV